MLKSSKTSLLGFRDLFGREARVKEYLMAKLAELFQLWGYERIELALIENMDSFSERIIGRSPWPEWNKKCSFILDIHDYHSSYSNPSIITKALLVPEGTVSVSRWLANLARKNRSGVETALPLKIFYIVPCFRNELIGKLTSTKGRHFTQAGIEIIGVSNCFADLETMMLISEGIKNFGVPPESIKIRIGDIRIFNALCNESEIQNKHIIPLKECMDAIAESRAESDKIRLKNERETLEKILANYTLNQKLRQKWEICLSGLRDQINPEEARILSYTESVTELNYLANQMSNLGIDNKIDLAVVRSHEYYTGIVYEVDIKSRDRIIVEVAGGGRYNKMIGRFLGERLSIPAVGFAYGVERLYNILKNIRGPVRDGVFHWFSRRQTDFVIYGRAEKFSEVVARAQDMRKRLLRTDIFIGDDLSEEAAKCYTKSKGAKLEVII